MLSSGPSARYGNDGRPNIGLDAKLVITGLEDRERVANRSGSDSVFDVVAGVVLEEVLGSVGFFNPWDVSIRRIVGGR